MFVKLLLALVEPVIVLGVGVGNVVVMKGVDVVLTLEVSHFKVVVRAHQVLLCNLVTLLHHREVILCKG